jgi:hypothetical protein
MVPCGRGVCVGSAVVCLRGERVWEREEDLFGA